MPPNSLVTFVAALLWKGDVDSPPNLAPLPPLTLHQIHILRAPTAELALEQALAIGKAQEHAYLSADDAAVQWRFLGLADLRPMGWRTAPEGAEELYSWFAEDTGAFPVASEDQLLKSANVVLRIRDHNAS